MHTHHKDLARALQHATGRTYQQALHIVRRSATAGQLPEPLDAPGRAVALARLIEIAGAPTVGRKPGPAVPPSRVRLGTSAGGPVFLEADEIALHTLVFGSAGTGKIAAIETITGQLLAAGWDATIIDMGGPGWSDTFTSTANTAGVAYQELTLADAGSRHLDLFAELDPDAAADVLMALVEHDDTWWQNIHRLVIGELITLLDTAHTTNPTIHPRPSLNTIEQILASGDLAAATAELRAVVGTPARFRTLTEPSGDHTKAATTLGTTLRRLLARPTGQAATPTSGTRLDVTAPGLTYVGLDMNAHPDISSVIAGGVLTQLTRGSTQTGRKRVVAILDAPWAPRRHTLDLLARGRSSSLAVVLSAQSPADWNDRGRNDLERVAQNTNVKLALQQGTPTAARLCAELLGGSDNSEAITPDTLRGLPAGHMYMQARLPHLRTVRAQLDRHQL